MTERTRIPPYPWAVDPAGNPTLWPGADIDHLPEPADLGPVTTAVPLPSDDPAAPALQALKLLSSVYPSFFPPYDHATLPFVFPLSNIPINVAPATTVVLGTFTVPPGFRGRVTNFGVAGGDLANLRWDFLIRGAPVPPITGLILQYGTIPAPTLIPGPGIVLSESDTCELQVTNIGLGIIANVQARADGYLWNPGATRSGG
jgi:hypothetical protein